MASKASETVDEWMVHYHMATASYTFSVVARITAGVEPQHY
jgi:hypothetical protein